MLPQLDRKRLGEATAGCQRSVQSSCVDLGRYYEEGNGVALDAERARSLYQRACDSGLQRGCVYLGLSQFYVPNVDASAVRRRFDRACHAGEMLGCFAAGVASLDGFGSGKNPSAGRTLLQRACQRLPEACASLALLYEDGEGVPKDLSHALALNVQACADGAAMGCTNAGHEYYFGLGVPSDHARAAQLAERACKLGSQDGCVNFGRALFGGDGVPVDRERAVQFFKPGCEMGNVTACQGLGNWYVQARRDPKSAAPALAFACAHDDFESCSNLGYLILNGDLFSNDRREALPYLQRACQGQLALGCLNLAALWHRFGSAQKAEEFEEQACELGVADACERAGWYWCGDKLVKADDARAVHYLTRACEGGRPWGCGHLGIFFEWGQGVSLDPKHAADLYEGGCNANDSESCLWLGILFRSGHGVPLDAKRGTLAIERSCQLGSQEGCGELGASYLDGLGVAANPGKGLALLRHACLSEVGVACFQLGFAYLSAQHVAQNLALARQLLQKGCTAKQPSNESCAALAKMQAKGLGRPVARPATSSH